MRDNGLREPINAVLMNRVRVAEGSEVEPTASIIDSQLVNATEAGRPLGYDAGKKVKGRKRHIVTDAAGDLAERDCDGALELIKCCRDVYLSRSLLCR
ncbi:hypothetical protein NPJ82_17960 (plasmid) [Sphingomonas sp. NY01]|uniref:transposase n=1 Tax=Sphingomonas sp. NY01 TaxID=2968057 RepID=UPI00315D9FF6